MTDHSVQACFEEGLRSYQAAQTPEDYKHALEVFSELLENAGELPDEVRRNSMLLGAKCLGLLSRLKDAETLLRSLLREIEPESNDSEGLLVAARLSLAEVLRATDTWQEATDLFLTTVDYFRQNGDWRSEANVHRTVAQLWQDHYQLDQAEAVLDTAWSILEQHEPTPLHLQVLFAQGHCRYLGGDVESAIELEERALAIARRLGDTRAEAQLVSNLAEFTFDVQDFQRAIHYNERKLREARTVDDPEETVRRLAFLGGCYTETGRPRKAIEMFDEARYLLSAHGQEESIEFGMCLLGKVQSLVDMKRYDEAKPMLTKARDLLARPGVDTGLLDRIEQRLIRETQSPLILDCAHRVLQMMLVGSSRNMSHCNPQPAIDLTQQRYLTSDLTDDDRVHFTSLHKELSGDLFQTRYSDSRSQNIPGTFSLPLKMEYVDDVESFEIKWAAYKRELEYAQRCAELQEKWEEIRNKFSYAEGVFRGDNLELIAYVSQLSRIAELCAELGNRELLREVALHAADFLEIQTTDPMLAALAWLIRGRLITAAHILAQSDCRELTKLELCRSFDQLKEVFHLLDKGRREIALEFIVESWFRGANSILGRDGYAGLVEIVDDLANSLDTVDRIRYGTAVGEACDPAEGVHLVDTVLAQARAENPNVPIYLAPEFETALAVNRFKALAPDIDACLRQYGPFAPYIHDEVRGWSDDIYSTSEQGRPAPQPRALAFTDGSLVVMDKRLRDSDYVATIVHEMNHHFRRVGQQLLTENGDWLLVKRDVPIASSLTYFEILQADDRGSLEQVVPQIQDLVYMGHRLAEAEPVQSTTHVNNMLRYFDDLGTQETHASYPCAAILLGMAFGYLGYPDAVRSYLEHLKVMDHDEALIYGRKKATLRL
ncbi:MAG: tetratricopeptide repeat protein [Saprospiraceae bacterium]|nr:tetratricopeptide repeat protein [Pyrinomonadaceae bacterium]